MAVPIHPWAEGEVVTVIHMLRPGSDLLWPMAFMVLRFCCILGKPGDAGVWRTSPLPIRHSWSELAASLAGCS